jgi:hypothetical protein
VLKEKKGEFTGQGTCGGCHTFVGVVVLTLYITELHRFRQVENKSDDLVVAGPVVACGFRGAINSSAPCRFGLTTSC